MAIPRANERCVTLSRQFRSLSRGEIDRDIKEWREAEDVVSPEDCLEFGQVRDSKICAFAHRAVIHSANFNGKSVGSGRNKQVRAEAAKFARKLLADVYRHGNCCSRDRHSDE